MSSQVEFPEVFSIADYFLFDRIGEGRGAHPAIRFGTRSWSYAQVADRSAAIARFLVDDGHAVEQRGYIVLLDTPPFAWSLFGLIAAGGVLAMGNPGVPPADLVDVLGYIKARTLFTTPAVAESLPLDALPSLRTILLIPDVATGDDPEAAIDDATIRALQAAAPQLHILSLTNAITIGAASTVALPIARRDDPAVWLFTSGSTGRSKAAMHSHRDFAFNTEVYAKRAVGYRADDITVSVPRLFFGYATGTNLWFPFAVGATACLFSERPTVESLAAAIAMYRPTIVTNVPTMLGKLLDDDDERRARGDAGLDFSSIRFHLSAGEALPPSLLERFVARFGEKTGGAVYDGIGSAEMFHIYCTNRPDDVMPGSLGRAVEGYELRVLADDAEGPGATVLPPGEIGILWVKGDSVAHGYFQDRDKSWKTFHGHWCRTGDRFSLDERGYLYFAGRADDLIKVGGVFVAPLEVEECLLTHDAVSSVAVIAADDNGLSKPKAIIVVRPEFRAHVAVPESRAALAAELQAHVLARLSKYKYPRWVAFVDELPKNDRGKVDKKALAALESIGKLAELSQP